MGKPNFKKIFIGLFLISFAFFLAVAAFYLLEVKPKMEARQVKKPKQKIKTMNLEKSAQSEAKKIKTALPKIEKVTDNQQGKPETEAKSSAISLDQFAPEERERREGTLWLDKSTGKFIATLGLVQGVNKGAKLDVYDGDRLIGSVEVDEAQAIVSFVQPDNDAIERSGKKYFRVIKQ